MHIICSTDSNYIMPTGVMMTSVCINNTDDEICFHVIIDESVSDKQKKELQKAVEENSRHTVLFHAFDESYMDSFPQIGSVKGHYMTKATYYRLMATKMLPENIDRIIYLDGDVIVNGSLNYLCTIDMTDKGVACITDMSEDIHDYDRLGYDKKLGYFNAGVLVINLKYWRENHVIDSFMDLILNQPERIKFHDQDVLNITFCKSKIVLPLEYNLQNGFLVRKERMEFDYNKYGKLLNSAINNAVIIHYTDYLKPWHIECCHPLKQIWISYLRKSKWRRHKLTRKYPVSMKGNILRFLKILPPLEPLPNPYR